MLVTAKMQITNNGHPITTAGHNYMLSYMLGFQPNVFPRGPGPGMNIQHDDINMWSSYPYLQNNETSPSTWYTNTNVVRTEIKG